MAESGSGWMGGEAALRRGADAHDDVDDEYIQASRWRHGGTLLAEASTLAASACRWWYVDED